MISKEKLVFDPTAAADTDNIGAYVRASDGTLITKTTVGAKERLDVNIGVEYNDGTAHNAGDRGAYVLAVDNGGNYAPLRVNAAGELLVDASITTGADKAEDAAAVSGDIGSYVLSVRQDALASSTSADGDYQSFKTNSVGALWVDVYHMPLPTVTAILNTQNSVSTVAELVVAADLANRKRILIQNASAKEIVYLGSSNAVTSADGIRLSAGAVIEMDLAAGVALYAIANVASADLRIMEFAA